MSAVEVVDLVKINTEYPLSIISRATFRKRIRYYNTDTVFNSVYLSGLFEIKTHADAPFTLFKGTELSKHLIFSTSQYMDIVLPALDTEKFEFTKAFYHLFVTNSTTGYTRRLLYGPCYCVQT